MIGDNVKIGNFNTISKFTEIGDDCHIVNNSSIGAVPQDKKFGGEDTKLNRGTSATGETRIGDDVLIMTGVHVAHDCIIGNNVILVNLVALGGHVEIDDWAILGGASNAHQFCKIGKHAMVAANSKLVQDVPPFILVGKHPVQYSGINSLGLSRRGFSDEEKADIKKAYRYLFRSDLNQSDALSKVRNELSNSKHINDIIHFYESSKRGII